jgi:hypothetical protein
MSTTTTIAAKLREYEHTGSYLGAIEDVYALIHHIADLEEEIDNLKEAADRHPVDGYGSDLPVGTVVLDVDEDAWQRTGSGIWELVGGANDLRETLSPRWAPYTIIYTPKGES